MLTTALYFTINRKCYATNILLLVSYNMIIKKTRFCFNQKPYKFFVTHSRLNHIIKCIKFLEDTIVSDLAATNCGCNSGCGGNGNGGCNSCNIIIWIILLSCLCGNGNGTGLSNVFGCGGGDDCGCGGGCNNSCIWLILILLFCGGGCGF